MVKGCFFRGEIVVARWSFVVITLCFFNSTIAHAQAKGNLDDTIRRLNAAAQKFKSAEASFDREAYTALVNDTDKQTGRFYVLKAKSGVQAGAKVDGGSTFEYKGGSVKLLDHAGTCTPFASAGRAEALLTLGFGGSGDDLKKAWEIKDLGQETLDGVKVEHLDLTPKDPTIRNTATRVELWMDLDRGVSLKQKLYSPSNDTNTARYNSIRINTLKEEPKEFVIKAKGCGK